MPSQPHHHLTIKSNQFFENQSARRALQEARSEEAIRNTRLYELGAKIRFQASRGMSRVALERIYGREIVADVFNAMRQASEALAASLASAMDGA